MKAYKKIDCNLEKPTISGKYFTWNEIETSRGKKLEMKTTEFDLENNKVWNTNSVKFWLKPIPHVMKLEYQGLTNSMRFVDKKRNVDIKKAYESYMQSEATLKSNLEFLINMENDEKALEILFQTMQDFVDMYFTIFESYKEYNAI